MITIQSAKKVVLCVKTSNGYGSKWSSYKSQVQEDLETLAHSIVKHVADGNFGFASDVANTVLKYGRASEKQAYVIARAAVENNVKALYNPFTGEEEVLLQESEY